MVMSSPFHGGVTGSNPVESTKKTTQDVLSNGLTRLIENFSCKRYSVIFGTVRVTVIAIYP